jgi:Ala-tRNA(Pro) deacylase
MAMPASPDDLFTILDKLGISTVTHRHAAVFTVEESRHVKDSIPGAHTKNLFVKDKKDNLFLIVAEGSAEIAMNRIHSLVGAKSRLSFANSDLLMAHLGVTPGSVTAFAVMNDHDRNVQLVIDEALWSQDVINCHPLTNTMTTTISKSDLERFLAHVAHHPLVVPLSGLSSET